MAKPPKRKVQGGRVTAKGTQPSGRYTPPTSNADKISPTWVPVLMAVFMAVGGLVIILNYLGAFGETDNWYLLLGLGFVLASIITATQWH